VTAQAVNHVGLSSFVTTPIRIVTEMDVPSGEIRGHVSEGPRMQPQLEVQLLDATGSPLASAMTDAQGQFSFPDLPPGEYQLTTEKPSSGRSAKEGIGLKSGDVEVVRLELTL
jgi:protocatechuate 3,4-dioxygenase beta subunit